VEEQRRRRQQVAMMVIAVGMVLAALGLYSLWSKLAAGGPDSDDLQSSRIETGFDVVAAAGCSVNGRAGTCVDYRSCSGTTTQGLCKGDWNIQCCVPASNGDEKCTAVNGVCKTGTCSGGQFVTGLCAGGADRRCCVPSGGGSGGSGKYTHAQAVSALSAGGITSIHSSRGCSDRYTQGCTSLDGVRTQTISGIIAFKKKCGCAITITGGTEVGHSSGTYSHENGYKLDIAMASCLTDYIKKNFKNRDATHWVDGSNIYYYEGNHWDITYF